MNRIAVHLMSAFSLATMPLLVFAASCGGWADLQSGLAGGALALAQMPGGDGWLVASGAGLLTVGAAMTLTLRAASRRIASVCRPTPSKRPTSA